MKFVIKSSKTVALRKSRETASHYENFRTVSARKNVFFTLGVKLRISGRKCNYFFATLSSTELPMQASGICMWSMEHTVGAISTMRVGALQLP